MGMQVRIQCAMYLLLSFTVSATVLSLKGTLCNFFVQNVNVNTSSILLPRPVFALLYM